MQLNDVVFGNPNRTHLIYLETENYLDSLLPELGSYPPPKNEGEHSSEEILSLIRYTNHLAEDENVKKRFEMYDYDFESYTIKKLIDSGIPEEALKKLVVELHKDIVPLLVKLKFHYNRPRPSQLAAYKKMPLHAFRSRTADSPSYPSGHCFQSKIYAEVLGNTYPQYYQALSDLANDVSISRQYMGLHYPSDSEFSMYAADIVLKHPDFRKKYKL